ncbi:MAG: type II secretion system secretin GspD [Thermodesulfobacteriota bacterium]
MKSKGLLLLLCLALLLPPFWPAHAARLSKAGREEPKPPAGASVTIDFRDVDIRVVAKFISDLTGKNFIFDKQVRDKVTVFSPTPVTAEEAYRLFETVLKVHGYTTVPTDGVINVVPSVRARTMEVETRPAPPAPEEAPADRVVTQLVRLKYADAREMQALLQPLLDKSGVLSAYQSGNTLIITEYATNIDRLMIIIEAIDVPGQRTTLAVIPLQHASARDLAAELQEILRAGPGEGQPRPQAGGGVEFKVVADERTNKLIVLARDTEIQVIRDLAQKLDVPAPRGTDKVHVYFLQNAVAEDLAKTLTELAGAQAAPAAQGGQPAPTRLLLQENVLITADKATNSLIIRAEYQDFLVLRGIIEQLDIQRAQVLVEGIIMEMSLRKATALGAEWRLLQGLTNTSGRVGVGGTNLPTGGGQGLINQMAAQPFAGPSGLVLGAAEGSITWGGATYLNLGLLIQALEQDSEVNILSTPHILTMDNEEARIVVGEERPFLKSSLTTDTGGTSPSVTNTYEFKDLGLTLQITPHITQGNSVRLKIFQQLKSFISEAETGAISSTKRETETMVVVNDGETVVIGGLIGNEERQVKTQVPCLGDIPLLGWLAKNRSQSGDKQNLLILIRPKIIRDAGQLRKETQEKEQEIHRATDPERPDEDEYPYTGPKIFKD